MASRCGSLLDYMPNACDHPAMAPVVSPRRDGVGAAHGVGRDPLHRWFRYPAGFDRRTLAVSFSDLTPPSAGIVVVDPFAGVATVGLHARSLGLRFAGIETHPEIAEVGDLKLRPHEDPDLIRRAATRILATLVPQPVDSETELVRSSFDERVLGVLVALRERIQDLSQADEALYLKWALLGTLRECADVKVGWPYQRPNKPRVPRQTDPINAFLRRVTWMADDLVGSKREPSGVVMRGDARDPRVWDLIDGPLGAVVTSPPYLNNYDYADATRLEMYFWGTARTWQELTSRVRRDMMAGSTQQTTRPAASAAAAYLAVQVPETSSWVAALTARLQESRRNRKRGKEYDQLVPMYFADITKVLLNLRAALLPASPVRMVVGDSAPYGVYIDTPACITRVAAELGFSAGEPTRLRTRGLRWHQNGTRHAVPLSESLIKLATPG